jgi:hypothetical protein
VASYLTAWLSMSRRVPRGALSAVQIHGTPTTPGSYTFTISVWCYGTNVSGQTGDKQYTLVVS